VTARAWFAGAIDLHVHSSPSLFPRRFGDVELAWRAAEAGMAGVAIKAHEGSTVERAQLVAGQVPGIAVLGGVVLNHFVGGFNPHAVELALNLGGRVVWMPTMHAANHLAYYGEAGYAEQRARYRARPAEPLSVLESHGKLKAEVNEILEVMAARGEAILSNGHLNAEETRALFRAARERGLERLLVAHPSLHLTSFSLEVQLELAGLGAIIEHCYLPHLPNWGGVPFERTAYYIQHLGAERCVLSSDLGQADSPPPAEGLKAFARALMAHGLSEGAIRRMIVENPAALLGL
jgi:hypothetical protein